MSASRPPKVFDLSLRMSADGPRGVPLVNNLRFLKAAHRYAMTTMAPYHDQPVVPVTSGNASVVVALGADAVRQVSTDTATFHNAGDGVFELPPGQPYSGMFHAVPTANNDEHKRRRRLLMPIQHRSAMERYREIFTETFRASRFAAPAQEPFDMVTELLAVSKTNMLRGLLGLDATPENHELASEILALSAVITRPDIMLLRWNSRLAPYGRWVGRVASAYERLTALIEERRSSIGERLDALSLVCAMTDEDGDMLSTSEIAGEVHGLLAAGFETTAMTMTWALLLMLAERRSLDATDPEALDAMVKESQRLLPAVPMAIPRRVMTDTSIAGSDPVPTGAMLTLSAVVEHHRATTYPDPFAYRPQRWLDASAPPHTAFLPFGMGPRRCLGAAFADLQVRTTLGLLVAERPLQLLTRHVDYRIKTNIIGGPRKPIVVRFAAPGERPAAPPVDGSVDLLWRQAR
jgi:cytochrome P450